MTSGKCPHPWNKTKKGTFQAGHKQINKGRGCFKKGRNLPDKVKELNTINGKKRYKQGKHPFYIRNLIASIFCNKSDWYGLGKKKWKELSKKMYLRDDKICQICEKDLSNKKHQCHHIIPYEMSFDNSEENLITLCVKCHITEEARIRKETYLILYPK
jgi:hypothetical protein